LISASKGGVPSWQELDIFAKFSSYFHHGVLEAHLFPPGLQKKSCSNLDPVVGSSTLRLVTKAQAGRVAISLSSSIRFQGSKAYRSKDRQDAIKA
jgi:hypothetical protein